MIHKQLPILLVLTLTACTAPGTAQQKVNPNDKASRQRIETPPIKVEPSEIPNLITQLDAQDENVRMNAALLLGYVDPPDAAKVAIPALVRATKDANQWVRQPAAESLGRIPPTNESLVALIDLMNTGDRDIGWIAANSVIEARLAAQEFIPELAKIMRNNKSFDVRYRIANALGNMGGSAKEAVPDLIEVLQDESSTVRISAAEALGKIGSEEAVQSLSLTLKDKDRSVRWKATEALGKIGPAAKEAVPALIEMLRDEDESVRHTAAQTLRAIGTPEAVETLKQMDM